MLIDFKREWEISAKDIIDGHSSFHTGLYLPQYIKYR